MAGNVYWPIIDLQQDFFGIEKRRWQLANAEDSPLVKSQQISLGLSYNKNNLLVSLEGYYKNTDDITSTGTMFRRPRDDNTELE